MLPFMKAKSVAGLIISKRKPDDGSPAEAPEASEDSGMDACSESLIRAIHSKDAKAVSSALRDLLEMMEPAEGEESLEDSNTYASQNIKAAKEQI